jgi:exonuclease VII small subunit
VPEQVNGSTSLTASSRYSSLETFRNPVLQRARDAAALTIPALMPPSGTSDATLLPTPFQSVGARGVNNLAARLLLALFPPGTSFFRLKVDEFLLDQLKQRHSSEDAQKDFEEALAKIERAVNGRIEQTAARPVLSETFKHLIVAGNGLLFVGPKGKLQLFTLDKYVCKRDGEGEPLEIILVEELSYQTLPEEAKQIAKAKAPPSTADESQTKIKLYTWIKRTDSGSWTVHQEICDQIVPGTNGTYPKGKCAWMPLRWTSVSGSDYGRGHVEEYIGDLYSGEGLSQSIIEFAANASKILWFVDPGSTTSKKRVADADSGDILDGQAKDVTMLGMEKFADFQVAKATLDEIVHRLEQAFLLSSSIQRNAERVTAEEIRFMAGELEQTLGGTYSILAQELQHPLVVRLMAIMQKERKLPHLPENTVVPEIITGLDGLGRSSDLMKLDLMVKDLATTFGPEAAAEYINVGAYAKRRATALSIDIEGVIRSEDEVQKSRQQQAQQDAIGKLGPSVIKGMSDQAKAGQQPVA